VLKVKKIFRKKTTNQNKYCGIIGGTTTYLDSILEYNQIKLDKSLNDRYFFVKTMTCNGVIVKSIGYNIKISGNIHKILIVDLVFETPGAINQYTVKDKMNLIPLYRGSEMYRDLQPLEVLSFSLLLENYIFLMNIPGYHKKNKTILRLYFLLNILCNDEFLSISAIRDIQQNHIKIKELLKDITTIVNKDINLFRFLYIHINSTNKSDYQIKYGQDSTFDIEEEMKNIIKKCESNIDNIITISPTIPSIQDKLLNKISNVYKEITKQELDLTIYNNFKNNRYTKEEIRRELIIFCHADISTSVYEKATCNEKRTLKDYFGNEYKDINKHCSNYMYNVNTLFTKTNSVNILLSLLHRIKNSNDDSKQYYVVVTSRPFYYYNYQKNYDYMNLSKGDILINPYFLSTTFDINTAMTFIKDYGSIFILLVPCDARYIAGFANKSTDINKKIASHEESEILLPPGKLVFLETDIHDYIEGTVYKSLDIHCFIYQNIRNFKIGV